MGVTQTEIASQLTAWRDAHRALQANQDAARQLTSSYSSVIATGCGSTHYLSMTAAALIQAHTGRYARAVPASELLFNPDTVIAQDSKPLLVTISRSAQTTETVQAAQQFRSMHQSGIITLSCYADRPLNAAADLTIAAPAAQEESVAQTRSFSAMTVMAEGLAQIMGGGTIDPDWFTDDQESFIQQANDFATPYADPERYDRYFFLGSGPRYGIAAEAMLKMKEMSLTSAEAYHPMEFRHGPMSMVDNRTVVIGLLAERGYTQEKAVLADMAKLGATVIEISPEQDADFSLASYSNHPAVVRYLPALQWMAYERAINKGLNPDQPRNLSQVIDLGDSDLSPA